MLYHMLCSNSVSSTLAAISWISSFDFPYNSYFFDSLSFSSNFLNKDSGICHYEWSGSYLKSKQISSNLEISLFST